MNAPHKNAMNVVEAIAQANSAYSTKATQSIVKAVTGVKLDGRAIAGRKRSQVYKLGGQMQKFLAAA